MLNPTYIFVSGCLVMRYLSVLSRRSSDESSNLCERVGEGMNDRASDRVRDRVCDRVTSER